MQTVNAISDTGELCELVQAWDCTGPNFNGYVYNQGIALEMMSLGCDIRILTIVRFHDGSRRYMSGVIADHALGFTLI